jgi:hypothetical protein
MQSAGQEAGGLATNTTLHSEEDKGIKLLALKMKE